LSEPQSNKPITAAEAFEAAGENLRQAEKGWSDTRVPTDLVAQVIDIANAWTALGVGLSGGTRWLEPAVGVVQEFNLGKDELAPPKHRGPCPVGPHCRDCHMETHRIDPVTEKCEVCRSDARQIWERGIGCVGGRPRPAVPDELLPQHVHSRPMCDHTWLRPMEPCANGCGARPEEGRSHLPCSKTCPDVTA
jgi:hypothetical protein